MAAKTYAASNAALSTLLGTAATIALITADASITAPTFTEVTNSGGSSYARQAFAYAAPANGATSNSGTITFAGLPACTVTGFIITNTTTGVVAYTGSLTTAQTIAAGNSLVFAPGAVTIGEV